MRTRLKRGLVRLRDALARERGSGEACVFALRLLARQGPELAPTGPGPAPGGSTGFLGFAIPAGVLVALLGLVIFLTRGPERAPDMLFVRGADSAADAESVEASVSAPMEAPVERASL